MNSKSQAGRRPAVEALSLQECSMAAIMTFPEWKLSLHDYEQ